MGQVVLGLVVLALLLLLGAAGYLLIEDGWSPLDAVYMSVTTLTTVGFREMHPLSPAGRVFTMVFVLAGLGVLLYVLSRVAQVLIEGELLDVFGRRRMMSEIDRLSNHYIVCGFGKVGRPVAEGLARDGYPHCVLDSDEHLEASIQKTGSPYLLGDATDEDLLERAGVRRAGTLLALLASDADNLYLTMAAKDLNPAIKVIARATDPAGETRLKRAGADDVVSPSRIAGLRVLQAAVNPTSVEFMEIVTQRQALQLSLADIPVSAASDLNGRTIAEAGIRGRFGVIIVAVKRKDGMEFNPEPDTTIRAGDILVVLGEDLDIAQLQVAAGG